MAVINKIILDSLEKYIDNNLDIEQDVKSDFKKLCLKLLEIEKTESIDKSGIEKLYDQIFNQFINNKKLLEWSEKYVHQ